MGTVASDGTICFMQTSSASSYAAHQITEILAVQNEYNDWAITGHSNLSHVNHNTQKERRKDKGQCRLSVEIELNPVMQGCNVVTLFFSFSEGLCLVLISVNSWLWCKAGRIGRRHFDLCNTFLNRQKHQWPKASQHITE